MKLHELKCINPYFAAVWADVKTFEIRKDDRGFEVSDYLWLREYIPGLDDDNEDTNPEYTGRSVTAEVMYILPAGEFKGLAKGYCAMQICVLVRKQR